MGEWQEGAEGWQKGREEEDWTEQVRNTTLGRKEEAKRRQPHFTVYNRSTHHMCIVVSVVERMRWAGEEAGLTAHSTGASDAMPSPPGTLAHHTSLKHLKQCNNRTNRTHRMYVHYSARTGGVSTGTKIEQKPKYVFVPH